MAAGKAVSAKDMNSLKIINLLDGTALQDAASTNQVTNAQSFAISRANHTGTQLSGTISDFNAAVRTNSLDQLTIPAADLNINTHKLTAVVDPVNPQDAATKNYVDTQTSATAQGLVLKGTIRAVVQTNVTLTAPGATLDGLTAANGELYALINQTTQSANGIYVYNGSAATMTRATNWATAAQMTLGSFWDVREGTSADTFLLCTNTTAITVGTTSITFVIRGTSSPVTGYTTTCPTTSAGASWVVTHSLNTKWIVSQVARVASPYDLVDARIERTSLNSVTVFPDIAMASAEYEIMVSKVA